MTEMTMQSDSSMYRNALGVVMASVMLLVTIPGGTNLFSTVQGVFQQVFKESLPDAELPAFADKGSFTLLNITRQGVSDLREPASADTSASFSPGNEPDHGIFYAKDVHGGYAYINHALPGADHADYQWQKIEGVDPATFVAVDDNIIYSIGLDRHVHNDCDDQFAIDGDVALRDTCKANELKTQMSGYSAAKAMRTSAHEAPEAYAKDKNHVYFGGGIVQGADPASFGSFYTTHDTWSSLARDKDRIYFKGKVVDGAQADSFRIVETDPPGNPSSYAADDAYVYYSSGAELTLLPEADPNTFSISSGFCFSTRAEDCDQGVEDKNHSYYKGKIIGE